MTRKRPLATTATAAPVEELIGVPEEGPPYFQDDMHALQAGLLIGALLKAGFSVIVEQDDEGNYTGLLEISLPSWDNGAEPIRVPVKVLP
jgi:hypothetical protein